MPPAPPATYPGGSLVRKISLGFRAGDGLLLRSNGDDAITGWTVRGDEPYTRGEDVVVPAPDRNDVTCMFATLLLIVRLPSVATRGGEEGRRDVDVDDASAAVVVVGAPEPIMRL